MGAAVAHQATAATATDIESKAHKTPASRCWRFYLIKMTSQPVDTQCIFLYDCNNSIDLSIHSIFGERIRR